MKISVIIPVYNVQDYLVDCIESVISQTYRNIEIILIDDGSTDKSWNICNEYAHRYSKFIFVLHQKNLGAAAARVAGINKASGEILVFLDSDDMLRADSLELIASQFQEKKCDLVLYDAGKNDCFHSKVIENFLVENMVYKNDSKKNLFEKLISYKIPNSVCLKAIRKEKVQIPDNEKIFYRVTNGEDLLMSAYFIRDCDRILYIKEKLYYYRMRPGSAVHSFNINRIVSRKFVHTEIENILKVLNFVELKPLHNTRKVRGWIDNLILLLKNKDSFVQDEFNKLLKRMSEDDYFIKAYYNMDSAKLSFKERILSYCLVRKQFFVIRFLGLIGNLIQKNRSV